jgi:hypothetical protein
MTWKFVLTEAGRGALQAVGGLAVWIAVILWILNSDWGSSVARQALETKYPSLLAVSNGSK